MKSYSLYLHGKQGDDFSSYVESTKTISSALENWAKDFAACQKVCERIAQEIKGEKIEVDADTHTILFCPKDKAAEKVLKALAKEKLLSVDTDDAEMMEA